ncbi:MAG TPA: glycosyltransferase family 4 protein [Terracidiphilus sp.]|nr:glycosyltransferase family 4 protein [Terracidiphilus sp.]
MTANSSSVTLQTPVSIPARSLAYLVSQYPMLSMIFVLREVVQLRELGFRIDVASINSPDRAPEHLTAQESAEARRTYYLKQRGLRGAVGAHFQTLLTNFTGYLIGLRLAFQLSGLDLKRLAFSLGYFTEALMVGRWMKDSHHHHLHVHLGSQAATVGLYVRHTFGFGLSITIHGPDEFYDAQGHYLEEKIAAADFVCCISSFARSQLMKCSPHPHWKKLFVSRLGVDPALFSPSPIRVRPNTFEILCVGRLIPAKGQHILIEAADHLLRQGWQVRLRLVGRGPDESSLRELAARLGNAESVVFEGAVNQDRIRDLYAKADIFCIPSFAEGIPVVLMEAMAMGIPCVTTRITGIPELIRDGIDGLLVTPSDVIDLADALVRLMRDATLREHLSRSGRARVMEHYHLRRNVEHLAEIFEEQIGRLTDGSRLAPQEEIFLGPALPSGSQPLA